MYIYTSKMVKNAGGNKAKGYARKNMVKGTSSLRVSEDPAEIYAQAIKISGGSMCRVHDLNGKEMNCHIRGKFRGRGKRDNLIVSGTWLLVGLREWEQEPSPGKLLNCDLIEVYSDSDKVRLKNSVTFVDWSPFIANDTRAIGSSENVVSDDIEFADDKIQEYQALIEAHLTETKAGKSTIIATEDGEEINVDDI
jgi:translation initiation factor IF-1